MGGAMDTKEPSETAGGTEIVGKTVKILHATEADMAFIEEQLKTNDIDTGNLDYNEFVVARENGQIVGFGRLRKTGGVYQIGCVVVVEDKRHRGVGSLIVKHLLDVSSVNLVYIVTDLVDYFKSLGFEEMKEGSKELLDALDEACKVKGKPNTALMVYKKTAF
jgi:N-acetylglutamate synthase-like GNAT family acetyltransferase